MNVEQIKQQVAKELGCLDFAEFKRELTEGHFGSSFTLSFVDKVIELALQRPQPGITVEQAKDMAAKEFGEAGTVYFKNQTLMNEHVTRVAEIYGDSCASAERQWILDALPSDEETNAKFEAQGYTRDYFNGMTTGAYYMKCKIKSILTNK